VRYLRPGGAVAFQEPWMMPAMGPESATRRMAHTVVETLRRSGMQIDLGARLHDVFTGAGLPQPHMRLEAPMDGREDSPLYQYSAETVASLLPKAVEYGIATAEDFDTDSLAARLSAERRVIGLAMMSIPLVAAWCRTAG
jgi:hypothetical protein